MTDSPYKTRSRSALTSTNTLPSTPTNADSPSPPPASSPSIAQPDERDTELATPTVEEATYPPSLASASTTATERELDPLPAPDRGKEAYLFLLGAFVVETIIWGAPSAYGVFLTYYQTHGIGPLHSHQSSSLLPLVGVLSSGMMYLLGPPVALLLNPKPRWRLTAIRIGAVLTVVALLASSFAKTPWQLLLTQGVLYSIGGSIVYYPTFSFLSEWFVARRGFANGMCFAGTAAGGLVYPFVLEALLSRYGAAVTLRALATTTFLLLLLALPLLRPRLPLPPRNPSADVRSHPSAVDSVPKKQRFVLWRNQRLWIFMLANTVQAIGYFLPSLYLPTFAASLGLSGAAGSAMLACVNASAVVSRISLGVLSDRLSPHILGAITMAAASISVVVLWGVTATSLAPLLVFSLMLGLAAGGWTSLYSSVIKEAAKDDPTSTTHLFALLSFTRGLGSLLTAPISSALLAHPLPSASGHTGYGIAQGKFGSLIVVVGVMLGVAGAAEGAVVLARRRGEKRAGRA